MSSTIDVCDVGSGAGFLDWSAFYYFSSKKYQIKMTLIGQIEKCKFLNLVKEKLILPVHIINDRVEKNRKKIRHCNVSFDLIASYFLLGLLAPLSKRKPFFFFQRVKTI